MTYTPSPLPLPNLTCAITHHADARMQQRGISEEMIDWAIQIGTVFQKQGMDMVVVRKKDIPEGMNHQLAGRLNGLVVLIRESNIILTAYKNSKTASRDLKRKDKRNMKKAQYKSAA